MKPHLPMICTLGLFLAVAGLGLSARAPLPADEQKPRATLGTPKAGTTFGAGQAATDSALAVAFSPDGKTLAAGSLKGTVWLWDAASGRQTVSFKQPSCQVRSLAFSPDGKTLALGGGERQGDNIFGCVCLWDLASGKAKDAFEKHRYGVYSVAFSPDGKTLASGGDERVVRLWDAASGREKAVLTAQPAYWILSVAFSPDGNTLAAAGGSAEPGPGGPGEGHFFSMVRQWDVASGKETRSFQGHTHWVSSVVFSPDGKTLASGSYDGTIRLWDVASGKPQAIFKGGKGRWVVLSVAFSPDGRTLASGGADLDKGIGTVRSWDVPKAEERVTFPGHGPFVTSVAFSPNGKILASGSGDTTVKLWDVAPDKPSGR
jgi:WD40 repeat protein